MSKDSIVIEKIISENDVDDIIKELENYIMRERCQALGWAHSNACVILDNGNDPRRADISEILDKALLDLSKVS